MNSKEEQSRKNWTFSPFSLASGISIQCLLGNEGAIVDVIYDSPARLLNSIATFTFSIIIIRRNYLSNGNWFAHYWRLFLLQRARFANRNTNDHCVAATNATSSWVYGARSMQFTCIFVVCRSDRVWECECECERREQCVVPVEVFQSAEWMRVAHRASYAEAAIYCDSSAIRLRLGNIGKNFSPKKWKESTGKNC